MGINYMTNTLFYENAYLKEYQTKIISVEGNKILLKETIFFPQTSNEPGDLGEIADYKVIGLKKEGDEIWHILNKSPLFKEGDLVNIKIDWNKRYHMMKLHSALHLWAGVIDQQFKERAVAGAVKSDTAYLVFKQELSEEVIEKSLKRANDDIKQGLEIKIRCDEEKKGFKWCQVGDYSPIPCGGLHVKNTNEIGSIIISKKELDGSKLKIYIKVK